MRHSLTWALKAQEGGRQPETHLGSYVLGWLKTDTGHLSPQSPGRWKTATGPPGSSFPRLDENRHRPTWVLTTQPGGRQPQACLGSHFLGCMKTDTGPSGSSRPRITKIITGPPGPHVPGWLETVTGPPEFLRIRLAINKYMVGKLEREAD